MKSDSLGKEERFNGVTFLGFVDELLNTIVALLLSSRKTKRCLRLVSLAVQYYLRLRFERTHAQLILYRQFSFERTSVP